MAFETKTTNNEVKKLLLKAKEDHFLDLKSIQIAPSKLQTHFVAFANTDGGELIVGVEDVSFLGERIKGFASLEDANDLINTLLSQTKPAVEGVGVEFLDFNKNGFVLRVNVPKSQHVHYTAADECYVRLNASTRRIKGEQITRLSYAKGSYSYERVPIPHVSAEEILESSYLSKYLEKIEAFQEPEKLLKKQRLLIQHEGKLVPTVACVLLFDDEPQASLDTRCSIKVYRLQTTERDYKREHLAEMPSTIEGSLEEQINKVKSRVSELLEDVTINLGGKRTKLKYPAEALEEILVNAIIHRDYSVNDDIHVRIYDNRVEIQSPGRLPGYVTLKNIIDERYSRNPNIVRMLHKLPNPPNHDIGEGLNTAYNAMRKAGLVEPEIKELENAVLVTVEHRRIASLEDAIVEYLKDNDTVTNKIVRQLTGEDSENKVKKALQKLRRDDVIEVVDPSVSVYKYSYRLKK